MKFAAREPAITSPILSLGPMPRRAHQWPQPSSGVWAISAVFLSGCDPVISVAGADFPAWILCLVIGILGSLCLKPVFVATGTDEWMTPRPLVYASLALTIGFACWLLVWR